MPELTLTDPPPGLHEAARTSWTNTPTQDPAVGQLWLLDWDGSAPALALITAVRDAYVLTMPASFDTAAATVGEAIVDETRLGKPVAVYHRAETGLGTFLLRRYVGALCTSAEVRMLRRAAVSDEPAGFEHGAATDTTVLQALVMTFSAFCNVEWPSATDGDVVLDTAALEAAGLTAARFAEITGLSVPAVLSLWTKASTLTSQEALHVTDALARHVDHPLAAPEDWITNEMRAPRFKDGVVRVAEHHGTSERAARNLVRSSFALAARTDSVAERRRSAIQDAITHLLER